MKHIGQLARQVALLAPLHALWLSMAFSSLGNWSVNHSFCIVLHAMRAVHTSVLQRGETIALFIHG